MMAAVNLLTAENVDDQPATWVQVNFVRSHFPHTPPIVPQYHLFRIYRVIFINGPHLPHAQLNKNCLAVHEEEEEGV